MALRVEVVYALPASVDAVLVELPAGAKVLDAVRASGMIERHPDIDLKTHRLGIHGKVVATDAPLAAGDRVEIYRPLAMDPKEARRRRALTKPGR